MFQINTPAPVQSISVASNTSFYCSCLNRLLIFDYHVKAKESKLRELLPIADNVYKHRPSHSQDIQSVDGSNQMYFTKGKDSLIQGGLSSPYKDMNSSFEKNKSALIEDEHEQQEVEFVSFLVLTCFINNLEYKLSSK